MGWQSRERIGLPPKNERIIAYIGETQYAEVRKNIKHISALVGVDRFELPNVAVKVRCLNHLAKPL